MAVVTYCATNTNCLVCSDFLKNLARKLPISNPSVIMFTYNDVRNMCSSMKTVYK